MYLLTMRCGSSMGVFGPLLPIRTRSAPTSSTMLWIKAGLSRPAVSATALGARFREGAVWSWETDVAAVTDDERHLRVVHGHVGDHARLAGLAVGVARVEEHHDTEVVGCAEDRVQQPAVVQPVIVVQRVHLDGAKSPVLQPRIPEFVDGDLAASRYYPAEAEQPVRVVAHCPGRCGPCRACIPGPCPRRAVQPGRGRLPTGPSFPPSRGRPVARAVPFVPIRGCCPGMRERRRS